MPKKKSRKKSGSLLRIPARFNRGKLLIFLLLAGGLGYLAFSSFAAGGNPYACAEPHPKLGKETTNKECVKHLKWYLSKLGYGTDPTVGDYSDKLANIVKEYQAKKGLEQTGVAGENVWSFLHNDIAKLGQPAQQPALGGPGSYQDPGAQQASAAQPPTVPQSLTITGITPTQVSLAWRASNDPELGASGVAGYRIIRNGVWIAKVQGGSSVNFNDTTVHPETKYTYQVRAVDVAGNLSEPSAAREATTPKATALTKPSAPANLTFKILSITSVRLSWSPSTGQIGRYYVNNVALSPHAPLALTSETSINIQNLQPGSTQTFSVGALSKGGISSDPSKAVTVTLPRNESELDTKAPDAPSKLKTGTVGSKYVELSWKLSPSKDVAKYLINRRYPLEPGQHAFETKFFEATSELASIDPATITTMIDNEVEPEKTYTYAITAIDKAGNESKPSNEVRVTVPTPDTEPPTAPTGFTAKAKNSQQIKLTWKAAKDNRKVTQYSVSRGVLVNGVVTERVSLNKAGFAAQLTGNKTNFTDKTVQPGTSYVYEISAVDADFNFSPTVISATTTTAKKPSNPIAMGWDKIRGWWPW